MKSSKSLCGTIHRLRHGETAYGYRAEIELDRIDQSTGEVTRTTVVAWDDAAFDILEIGLQGDLGVTGFWRKTGPGQKKIFSATRVARLKIIDPRSLDLAKYL